MFQESRSLAKRPRLVRDRGKANETDNRQGQDRERHEHQQRNADDRHDEQEDGTNSKGMNRS